MCRILHLHSGLMWGNISPAGCVYLIIYLHLHKIFLIYCLKKLIIRVPPPKEIYLKFFLIVNITVRFLSWPLHALLWGGPLRAWGLFKPSGRGARSLLLPRAAQWHRLEDSPDGITDGFCVRYVLLFTRIMSGIFKIPSWYPYWKNNVFLFLFVCLKKLLSVNFVNPTSEVVHGEAVVSTNLLLKKISLEFFTVFFLYRRRKPPSLHISVWRLFCCECSQTNLDEYLQQPTTSQPWASSYILKNAKKSELWW